MAYTHGTQWTPEKIKARILESMVELHIKRMPTRSELFGLRFNDPLHNGIARSGGYDGWAKKLGLEVKESESKTGWEYEEKAMEILTNKGYAVKQMSTKFPYDLLVNGGVKIDVKVGKPWILRGSRVHTFGINKKNPVCDIYIIFALDEQGDTERLFIIPSIALMVVSMCIGKESKYNEFIDRWDFIDKYSDFYNTLIQMIKV